MPDSAAAGDARNAIREASSRAGGEVPWWRYTGTLPPWLRVESCIVGGLWMLFFFALAWWVRPAFLNVFIPCLGVPADLPVITDCFIAIFMAVPTRMLELVGFAGGIGIMVKDRWVSKRARGIANRTAVCGILISAALVAVAFFWPIFRIQSAMRAGGR